jgi:hypothetical protein
MKKQYIAPSQFIVNLMGTAVIATSAQLTDDPKGINMNNVSGDSGNAYDDAAVKGSTNVWDEEW